MLEYVFKRLLLVVPSLLLISFLAFGLNQCTDVDEVIEHMPSSSNTSAAEAAKEYIDNYKRIAHKLGADQPLFYLSVTTAAYPDTLHKIMPKQAQETIKRLIAIYGNWPAIDKYYKYLQQSIHQAVVLSDQYKSDPLSKFNSTLSQLSLRSQADEVNFFLDSLTQQIKKDSLLQAHFQTEIKQLSDLHTQLAGHKKTAAKYLPAIYWHGFNNQYHNWLSKILKGDFGVSKITGQPVVERIYNALRWTIQLNGLAIFFAYAFSIPLGIYAARWAGSRFDRWINLVLVVLYAMPSFWVGTMLSKFLTLPEWFDLFPVMGVGEVPDGASWWETLKIRSHHLFLPVFCMSYVSLAYITRLVRNSMLTVLDSDYIRTARAKGLSENKIIWKHAFRNALSPIITLFAGILPQIVSGSIIIEMIFGIPGIGWLTIQSILSKDWSIVYALLLLTAILTIAGILIADLLYAWADPRVQLSSEKQKS